MGNVKWKACISSVSCWCQSCVLRSKIDLSKLKCFPPGSLNILTLFQFERKTNIQISESSCARAMSLPHVLCRCIYYFVHCIWFLFFFPVESFKWKRLRLVLKTGTRLNILLWDFFSSPPPFPSKVINWIIYRFHKHNSRLHVHMSMHLYAVMHMQWQENNEDKQNILYAKQWQ